MTFFKNRYHFKPSQSPTVINLTRTLDEMGWGKTHFAMLAAFGDRNLIFEEQIANTLEYKDRLAALCREHCPHVIPQTFYIDDYNWTKVLNQIVQHQQNNQPWILKPARLNNGEGIHIFNTADAIEAHCLSSKRFGGPHVLQSYIHHPHLLRGHKYSIRLFVILDNQRGAFLYPDGYCNVARTPYQPDQFSELGSHITNEHLQGQENNVIQIPTREFDFFQKIYPQLKHLVRLVFTALYTTFPNNAHPKIQRFAIFGFDFLMDDNMNPWLLEANHGPCFPVSNDHPLQHYLYKPYWRDFIKTFVQPHTSEQSLFDCVYSGLLP